MSHLFDRIGRQWQGHIDHNEEYEVLTDGNVFSTSFHSRYVFRSDYDRARRLRDRLMAEYNGRTPEDVFCGREVVGSGGIYYVLESETEIDPGRQEPERARAAILPDLTLIRGIGKRTEERLKRRGFETIADLAHHPQYRREAGLLLDHLADGNSRDLTEWIGRRHHRSHPLVLEASRFHDPEDFVFLDIETLGLFSRPIILLGIARMRSDRITVYQYLLRSIEEEPAVLTAALSHLLETRAALVTFNGRAFDLPYLHDRLAYYGIHARPVFPHFDALHFARRRWRDVFPSCRLVSLERALFGVSRCDDIPSQMVPEFYEAYQRTGNPGPLLPVVEHNRQDIISLARLFSLLRGDCNGSA